MSKIHWGLLPRDLKGVKTLWSVKIGKSQDVDQTYVIKTSSRVLYDCLKKYCRHHINGRSSLVHGIHTHGKNTK